MLDSFWPLTTAWQHVVTKSVVEICTVDIFMSSTSLAARDMLAGDGGTLDANATERGRFSPSTFSNTVAAAAFTLFCHKISPHVVHEMTRVTWNDARLWFPYNVVAYTMIPPHVRPANTTLVNPCGKSI